MGIDWDQLLALAPLALGKPGNPRSAAMMQGYLQSQDRIRQQQLQAHTMGRQDALADAQIQNLQADNERANQQQQQTSAHQAAQQALARVSAYRNENQGMLGALQKAPEEILPPDADPLQAQNQLTVARLGAQQDYGVPPGTPQGPLPNMTQLVSEGKKRRAKALYERAEKQYGPEAMAGDSITLKTGEQFGDIKPSALRALFSAPAMDASGQPAKPYVKTRPSAQPGSFEEYIDAPPERQAQIEGARKKYGQADDRTAGQPRNRFNVQPITNPDGTTGLVRINMDTGETTLVSLPQGAGAGRASDTSKLSAAYLSRSESAHTNVTPFEATMASLGAQANVQLPNLLKSPQGQLYAQGRDEFINAALRRESGAAIQPSEYTRFDKIYFVQPGDSAAVIRQKQSARRRVIEGFRTTAGNIRSGDGGTTSGPAVGERRTVNGQPAVWDGKGWKAAGVP
jgi:hypothetical protein